MDMITDQTLIPLGLAVTAIGGVTYWLASITQRLDDHMKREEKQGDDLAAIKMDIEVIKELVTRRDRDG